MLKQKAAVAHMLLSISSLRFPLPNTLALLRASERQELFFANAATEIPHRLYSPFFTTAIISRILTGDYLQISFPTRMFMGLSDIGTVLSTCSRKGQFL